MIALFTDFGLSDPYVGQLHAVFAHHAPGVPVIDLFHAAPKFDSCAAAYLLSAYTRGFPADTVFVCIVDPGVGGARLPVAVRADERWYVGPDNGLFSILTRRAEHVESYAIRWRPTALSASFHGRDLFAPIAARLARGETPEWDVAALTVPDWPEDLAQIIHIDHYGNALTGLRGELIPIDRQLCVGDHIFAYARVFADAPPGQGFWYVNSNGLVEFAVREDDAAHRLGLRLGMEVRVK